MCELRYHQYYTTSGLCRAELQQGFMIGGMGLRVILRSSNSADQRVAMGQKRHMQCTSACSIYPQQQHQMQRMGMSAMGQKRTFGNCSVLHKLPHGHFPLPSKAGEDVTLVIACCCGYSTDKRMRLSGP